MTCGECVARMVRRLVAAGRPEDDSRRDAVVLARWRLGWTAAQWLARASNEAPAGFEADLAPFIDRRARGEPVAYITGEREFFGRAFRVTPDVLIPRPETELVVEDALARLESSGTGAADRARPVIVDVGTGSGCLAVTLALERPAARVVATDISDAALDVARDNARRLGAERIEFRPGSLLAGVGTPVDLIVSNPPYVATADRASLPVDVVSYEPASALFGGDDGLDVMRGLVPTAAAALRPGGWLVMEIGLGQAVAVERLLEAGGGWTSIRIRPDLQQIPRVVAARKRAPDG
ncbi:MAG: peptide chain release factor N(5)-glutamine methyltransferase [Vicinamibacterales bacterium]